MVLDFKYFRLQIFWWRQWHKAKETILFSVTDLHFCKHHATSEVMLFGYAAHVGHIWDLNWSLL